MFELLPEPVGAHAVARPLRLADPAPLEAAAGPCANHVHAAASAFRRRAALRARLCRNFDRHLRRFVPSGVSDAARIDRVFAGSLSVVDRRRFRKALADVEALTAGFAEHKLLEKGKFNFEWIFRPNSTYPASVLAVNPRAVLVDDDSHPAVRLRT